MNQETDELVGAWCFKRKNTTERNTLPSFKLTLVFTIANLSSGFTLWRIAKKNGTW
jgi:hypothetical protein